MNVRCVWPNAITLLSLTHGLVALWAAFNEAYFLSFGLIVIAAILDRYDGKLARYLGCASTFGAFLDTFCDIVVFLVVVAMSVFLLTTLPSGVMVGLLVFYVLMGLARLWRFHHIVDRSYNVGLPVTAAGPMLYGLTLLRFYLIPQGLASLALESLSVLLIAGLMVATFKVKR